MARRRRDEEFVDPGMLESVPGTSNVVAVIGGYRYELDAGEMTPGTTFFIPTANYDKLATLLDELIVLKDEGEQSIELIATPCLTAKGYGVRVIVIRASPKDSLPQQP